MRYGFFDNDNREYVITRPDTPTPWANYLGSPEYAALISVGAGGYSFAKSGAKGRILRYNFNSLDFPGRYLYIRDNSSTDYWSASWKPVKKPFSEATEEYARAVVSPGADTPSDDIAEPDTYISTCRHGMGYTRFYTDYAGVRSVASYYVPLNKTYEVWEISLTNTGDETRSLTVTGYAEFTNDPYYSNDMVNLQYTQFISRTFFKENRILQEINGNLDIGEKESELDEKQVVRRFFGLAGGEVSSYCGDRASFLGNGRDYSDPVGVTRGSLSNTLNYNSNSCGALSAIITLEPGQTKTIAFLLGERDDLGAAEVIGAYSGDVEKICSAEMDALRSDWAERFSALQVKTPSVEFDTMINTWHAYNCFMTFIWSRAASFIYCGERNGYGYRDTVQDIQGIIHLRPTMRCGFFLLYISTYRRRAMWLSSTRSYLLPTEMRERFTNT